MQNARVRETNSRSTAVTLGSGDSLHDSIIDRDSMEGEAGNPDWCVDLGEELKAMNKFELWLALGTGDVPSDVRVWKLGRERWQPAHEIPDLACALKLHAAALRAAIEAAEGPAQAEPIATPMPTATTTPMSTAEESDVIAIEDAVVRVAVAVSEQPAALRDETPIETAAVVELDAEAKSATPGPATVDTERENPIPVPVVRRRRAVLRRLAASPLSGLAALTALVATSLFTLPGALSSSGASAAAHLPVMTDLFPVPVMAELAPEPVVETPALASVAFGPTVADEEELSSEASPDDAKPHDAAEEAPRAAAAAPAAKPRVIKHHVRPTSVSPSHRGQGRQRQKSR